MTAAEMIELLQQLPPGTVVAVPEPAGLGWIEPQGVRTVTVRSVSDSAGFLLMRRGSGPPVAVAIIE